MGGSGGSQPSGNTTTVQKADPWGGQQPYLNGPGVGPNPFTQTVQTGASAPGIYQQAADLYQNYTPQYFPSSTVSPFTAPQSAALSTLGNPNLAAPVAGAASNYGSTLLNGGLLNNNPATPTLQNYASGNMLGSMQPAIDAAVQRATPGLLDSFTGGNRLNSPGAAQAVGAGEAQAAAPYVAQEQAQQLAAAGQLGQNYNQGVTAMNQGLAFAPQTAQLPYAGAEQQFTAGGQQQQQNQAQLNAAIQQFNWQQQLPYNELGQYQNFVQGGGSVGSVGTTTQPYFTQPGANPWIGALGGAASGAAAGTMVSPGYGTAIGAVLGGLYGGLSS